MSEANEIHRVERSTRTTPVWLVNADGDATVHDFVGREPAVFKGVKADSTDDEPAVALLFKCRDTGAIRRYGIDNPRFHVTVTNVQKTEEV